MLFNGKVGDLGTNEKSSVIYSKTYKGKGTRAGLEKHIKAEAKRQGIEILKLDTVSGEGGAVEGTVRFRSTKGII